jgi:flagellar protein FliS
MQKQELLTVNQFNSGIGKYVSNGVMTRTPELLILDLYDGCLRFLNAALEGFDEESYEKINNNCRRASAIIDELTASLNYEAGGDIAVNFRKLYMFISRSIMDGNIKKDRKCIEDALKIAGMMRETWSDGVVRNRV